MVVNVKVNVNVRMGSGEYVCDICSLAGCLRLKRKDEK